ncbi:MAG: 4Fe-4S binding protein, partial [Malacoplasma sp.]|nr:4Fe-4S binding protein [Malacoplasma sp.]
DYDTLIAEGSMMGSGGLIVMDEDSCMVDICKFYMEFIADESCGKCVPCRIGTHQLLMMLNKITDGKGTEGDLARLEELCYHIKASSLCGLGQTAPNPILATLKFFKDEYIAHVRDKKCPAGVCKKLLSYVIVPDLCKKCGLCKMKCPVQAITGDREHGFTIDQSKCIKCGACASNCHFKAIIKK